MRFLAVAVFAGLLLSVGEAAAQRFGNDGHMQWPDTPEISGDAGPVDAGPGPTRNPKAWPGTDGPRLPGTTVPSSRPARRAATQAQPASPPSQPAQSPQAAPATQSAGADPNPVPVERRRLRRAEPRRQERVEPRQSEAEAGEDLTMPPVPDRGIATAQPDQAPVPQAPAVPAEPVVAAPAPAESAQVEAQPVPAPPQPLPTDQPAAADAAPSQPVPQPPAPEPVPQQVATPPAPAETAPEQPVAAVPPVENPPAPSPAVAEAPAAPPSQPPAAVPEPAAVEQAQVQAPPPPESALPAAAETPAANPEPAPPQAETAQQSVPVNPPAEPQSQAAAAPEATPPPPGPDAAPAEPAAVAETPKAEPAAATPEPPAAAAQAEPAPKPDSALLKMVGQMIVTGFVGTAPEDPDVRRVVKELRNGSIGGVIVADRNINSSRQLKALTAALRGAAADPLPLLVISHEGGLGQGMSAEKGFSAYPSASALGRSNDPLNAFNVYRYMAEELAAYGFNVNLGPVIDMDRFPADESADGRSYGISAKHVAAFAKAFRQAHHQKNIATVLKHFPPLSPAGEQAGFEPLDVVRELVDGGDVDVVMAASPREGAGGDKPVEALLRDGMGYRGVVVSDVDAKEQAASGSLDDRVRQAVAASSDLLLIGLNDPPAPDGAGRIGAVLVDAVMAGVIKREAIEAAHDRVAGLKESLDGSGNAVASADGKGERKPASPR